jgi:hypothetical protein
MAIYSTDTYEILSIMNTFKTNIDNVTTFQASVLHVQLLPKTNYSYVVPVSIERSHGFIQDDYDVYDRFTANVIPIFETIYYPVITNTQPQNTKSSANSAISPISMFFNSATF